MKKRRIIESAVCFVLAGVLCALSVFIAVPALTAKSSSPQSRSGIVRLWNIDTFEGGKGSRSAFLNRISAAYEKAHDGVYIMVSSYTAEGSYIESEYKFQDRDVIISCEGKNVYLTSDLMDALEGLKDGELANFKISRVFEDGRKIVEVEIMMRADADFSGMTDTDSVWECIGVAKQLSEDGETYTYKMASTAVKGFGFFETVGRAFTYSIRIAGTLFRVLGELLTGALGLSAFGGPITTIRMTSAIATLGWVQFFEITALIGVNLAVFNLLPIPALDGSKVVFTIIEWIRGKPVNRKVEAVIHTVGFLFLIGFAILVDILQLF